MRQEMLSCQSKGEEKSNEKYLRFLEGKGAVLNPKLFMSKFELRNGLAYTGVAAKSEVKGGEVLIRIPEELIMSAAKAFEDPQLKGIFSKEVYFRDGRDFDEDKILNIYCMMVLQRKDEGHPWYQMIRNFPKECDIACFWSEEELEKFKDKTVKSAAEIDAAAFEREWSAFVELQGKY
jgi:hypothetical protein